MLASVCVTFAPAAALRHSPLHERHAALSAKLADFGGLEMPIEYPGGGVIKEHPRSVRRWASSTSAISARRRFAAKAAAFVQETLSNDLDRIHPGKAQYTLCVDDASGGVVDDLIAYLRGSDDVFLAAQCRQCRRGHHEAA